MTERKKIYRIGFFGDHVKIPNRYESGFDILASIDAGKISSTPVDVGSHPVGLRELTLVGSAYQGVVGLFRQSDLPVVAKVASSLHASDEHKIPMDSNEGLLEKTHFVLYRRPPLLLMQSNSKTKAPGPNIFAAYLKEVSGENVLFSPVLRQESYERMLRDDLRVRDMEVRVARPLGIDALSEALNDAEGRAELLKAILRVMNDNNAVTLNLKMKASMLKRDETRTLHNRVKSSISAMLENFSGTSMLEKAQLNMEDVEGKIYPIDLIADRLITKIKVEADGRYPNMISMFREMVRSKDNSEKEYRAFFQQNAS